MIGTNQLNAELKALGYTTEQEGEKLFIVKGSERVLQLSTTSSYLAILVSDLDNKVFALGLSYSNIPVKYRDDSTKSTWKMGEPLEGYSGPLLLKQGKKPDTWLLSDDGDVMTPLEYYTLMKDVELGWFKFEPVQEERS